jgi:hypothetical protein
MQTGFVKEVDGVNLTYFIGGWLVSAHLQCLNSHPQVAWELSIVGLNGAGLRPGCGFELLLPRMTTQIMAFDLLAGASDGRKTGL